MSAPKDNLESSAELAPHKEESAFVTHFFGWAHTWSRYSDGSQVIEIRTVAEPVFLFDCAELEDSDGVNIKDVVGSKCRIELSGKENAQ